MLKHLVLWTGGLFVSSSTLECSLLRPADVRLTHLVWQCGCRLMNVIDVSIEVSFEFARLPVVMTFVFAAG